MIRTLVVDDSAVIRRALTEALGNDPEIQVVGAAPDPYVARNLIATLSPDVMTLDLEMPRMDGITFLKHVMKHHPIPAIIVSSLTRGARTLALEALSAGALDVVNKPDGPEALAEFSRILREKVRAVARVNCARLVTSVCVPAALSPGRAAYPLASARLIAIGASTGGTVAIEHVLRGIPSGAPPIAIVQHMPPGFTRSFAERLARAVVIEVREAADGDELRPGLALMAPGNRHLEIVAEGPRLRARLSDAPPVNRHRPSVDVLFESAAAAAARGVVGALLTGMGGDGAAGLLALKRVGNPTIVQDEATCAVYGMPRVAVELGAADEILPLGAISKRIVELTSVPKRLERTS